MYDIIQYCIKPYICMCLQDLKDLSLVNIILADKQTENDRKEQTGQKQTSFILGFKNITIY